MSNNKINTKIKISKNSFLKYPINNIFHPILNSNIKEQTSKNEKIFSYKKETRNSFFQNSKIIETWINNNRNSLIIFDWDDTLLCTSHLFPFGNPIELNKNETQKISLLEEKIKEILKISIKHGKTLIITNSKEGWVEYSCQKFLPNVYPLFKYIKIISARKLFEYQYPFNFRMWKIETFIKIFKEFKQNFPINVISIGDSICEIDAGKILSKQFNNCVVKTIKFKENPTIDELCNQIMLIIEKFDVILNTFKNWNFKIEKKNMN